MATSGSLTTSSYEGRYLILSWTATQSIDDNTSTISWTLKGAGTATSSWYYAGNFKVVIAGSTVYSSSDRIQLYNGTTVASGTKTISHNSDGTKSVVMSAQAGIYTVAVNCSGSKTFTLTDIPRKATITSAPNFTSNENPTIKYSNLAGNSVTTLQACISLDGTTDDIAYRDISKTGTSYTFNLTDDERAVLNNATTSNSRTIKFYVKSIIGGKTYYSSSSKTYTIANSSIIFSPSVYDTNSTTTALTGSNSIIVKYFSTAYARSGAGAQDGATIASQSISCGGKIVNDSYAVFANPETNSFVFTATDSRGNVGSTTIEAPFVDYIRLTCNISPQTPTTAGELDLTVKGNYFNSSFGAVSNTLTVEYRYKEEGGSYSDWVSIASPTASGNTYTATTTLTGLNYKTQYIFEARVTDKLAIVYSSESQISSEPVFDWSNEDFNFNVPVNMNGKTVLRESDAYNHTVLSANGGSIYMRPNGTDDTTGEARLYPDGSLKLSGELTTGAANITSLSADTISGYSLSASSADIAGDLSITGSLNCSKLGCDIYNIGSIFYSRICDCTANLYHIKPFNLIVLRIYVSGLYTALTADTSYNTIATLNSQFYPAANVALSNSAIKDCSVLLNTSGEIRVCAREGLTTSNALYLTGIYPLSSSSSIYCY